MIARVLLALLLAACASSRPEAPAGPDPEAHVREVLERVGTDRSLADWRELAKENASVYQLLLDDAQQSELKAAIERSFDPAHLLDAVVDHFLSRYDEGALRSLDHWYSSPLGARILELEAEAGTEAKRAELARYSEGLTHQPPPTIRVALAGRLDRATHASENLIAMRVGTRRALVEGLRPYLGEENTGAPEELETQLAEMREHLLSVTPGGVRVMILFTLRGLSIVEVVRYVEWAERPAARWYFETLSGALESALARASETFAAEMQSLVEAGRAPATR